MPGWEKDCEEDEALDLTRRYEWDAVGNLTAVKDGNGNTLAEYDYDFWGRRIKKRYIESGNAVREVLYGYAGLSLAVAREWERFNDGGWTNWRIRREYLLKEAVRLFVYSDETDTEADEILLFRYVYDLSSNVAAILDENGEIVRVDPEGRTSSESNFVPSAAAAMCLFEYDAFGNNLYRATPNQPNSETAMHIAWNEIFPHHLAGKEWDTEARLYYFGHRWYEPQQGVFISRSPLGPLAEEPYAYCNNNSINYFDPDGLDGIVIGGDFDFVGLKTWRNGRLVPIGYEGELNFAATGNDFGFTGSLGPAQGVNIGADLAAGWTNADKVSDLEGVSMCFDVSGPYLGCTGSTDFVQTMRLLAETGFFAYYHRDIRSILYYIYCAEKPTVVIQGTLDLPILQGTRIGGSISEQGEFVIITRKWEQYHNDMNEFYMVRNADIMMR